MFLEKRPSRIDGIGIHTTRPIQRGEIFYTVPLNKIYKTPKSKCARIGDSLYVDDPEVLNAINHSCEPNIVLDITTSQPVLRALRDIAPGEELVCDYSETEAGGTAVPCTCKRPGCKGTYLSVL